MPVYPVRELASDESRTADAVTFADQVDIRSFPRRSLGVALVVTVFAASGLRAAEPDPAEERFASVTKYLAAEQARQGIPGMSVAIVEDNKLVWSRGFGLADVENDVPATPQTVYRIGSVSKMITATAVMQLVQSGRISLRASVRDYVPELPDKGETITVRHVLAHLSGIRHFRTAGEFLNREPYARLVDTLAVFKDDPLVARPGERYVYSTWAYNLLGLVVERVSGEPYGDYLAKQVFEPVGMTATGLDDVRAVIPHRARGYARTPEEVLLNSPYIDLSVRYPGDGIVSTAEDLARFAAAFNAGKILEQSVRQVMTTEHRNAAGEPVGGGLGCFVRDLDGRKIIGHAGTTAQASAFLLIVPGDDVAVAVLTNLERADVKTIGLTVARELLGQGGE